MGDHRVLDKQREIARMFYQNALELGIPFIVVVSISCQFYTGSLCFCSINKVKLIDKINYEPIA